MTVMTAIRPTNPMRMALPMPTLPSAPSFGQASRRYGGVFPGGWLALRYRSPSCGW